MPVPLNWLTVGQGSAVLAIGAVEDCLDKFFSSIISVSFLPLIALKDGPIYTKILSQRAIKSVFYRFI